MRKQGLAEIILYLITGLIYLVAYYFLMVEYFKINPFEGYYLIITIYFLICYVLYPLSARKISEATENKKSTWIISAKTQLLFAYIFAPFIFIVKRQKK